MILDTHQHFWKADRGDYHWMTPAVPILARDYLPSDLRPELRKAGIGQTILVQAAQTADETDFLLKLAEETDFVFRHQARSDRRKRIKTLPAAPLAAAFFQLPVASAYVIPAHISRHILQRLFARNVLALFANDHYQLAFVIHFAALRALRQAYRFSRGDDRIHALCKHHWKLR